VNDSAKSEEQDIPFEDAPARATGAADDARGDAPDKTADAKAAQTGATESEQSAGTGTGTGTEAGTEAPDPAASKDRTPPGPGSTGPTGVREDLGTLADEARKLWATLEARVVGPAIESYPEVARHLGAAGREIASAFRSVVRGSEQTWRDSGSSGSAGGDGARQQEKIIVERVDRIDPSEQKNRD